jgi:hypothetical protein
VLGGLLENLTPPVARGRSESGDGTSEDSIITRKARVAAGLLGVPADLRGVVGVNPRGDRQLAERPGDSSVVAGLAVELEC